MSTFTDVSLTSRTSGVCVFFFFFSLLLLLLFCCYCWFFFLVVVVVGVASLEACSCFLTRSRRKLVRLNFDMLLDLRLCLLFRCLQLSDKGGDVGVTGEAR